MNQKAGRFQNVNGITGTQPIYLALPNLARVAVLLAALASLVPARAATNWTLVGWNNLGMHCMDSDYSVFSILPPYNVINAQLIDANGHLLTNSAGITVTYQAIADPTGSINKSSRGKTGFWQYVSGLFGLTLPVDVGLPVPGPASFAMPGTNNVPQAMAFDDGAKWFAAYGVPITPYDDAGKKNPYPMMRLVAKQGATVLATADIVLPVSDEMDCRACHGSGTVAAAMPKAGWVNNANPDLDYRLNILRLHDDRQMTDSVYRVALGTNQYNTNGLYATAVSDGRPILCAACHLSEALPGSGLTGIEPLTEAVHTHHGPVVDPTNGMTLDASSNRSACYRCHPGSTTRCLRGAMGKAVAPDGSMLMQCQSCHGSMSLVGSPDRTGWLMEPNCQGCHTGTATQNNGQIRYTSVFDSPGHMRVPINSTFATTPDAPAPGLSLYRFSAGHGGLKCSACHGSTHAEFPASHPNDNITSIQHQGHVGTLVECSTCHATVPNTVNGGPHGMHPVGSAWVSAHHDLVEHTGASQCQGCHGSDYTGTVLSRSQADRTFTGGDFGTKTFWRGYQIGCYTCHNGPSSDNANPNRPPVVNNTSASAAEGVSVAVPLTATDPQGRALTVRIVSQTSHGSVGLSGTVATYFPDPGYIGGDTFTFAASNGQLDSNLGSVLITVGGGGCTYAITPSKVSVSAFKTTGVVTVTAGAGCAWKATKNVPWLTITSGASGVGKGTVKYSVAGNNSVSARTGTLTIAGFTYTVTQAGSKAQLTGHWDYVKPQALTVRTTVAVDAFQGWFTVQNVGEVNVPRTSLAIYLSDKEALDTSTATLLKIIHIRQLNPGQEEVRPLRLKPPKGGSLTGKYLIALVDADDQVPDGDEDAYGNDNDAVPYGPLP